jgi:hypothetical protein
MSMLAVVLLLILNPSLLEAGDRLRQRGEAVSSLSDASALKLRRIKVQALS